MDIVAKEERNHQKRGLITKTWERCKSVARGSRNASTSPRLQLIIKKSKSWHGPGGARGRSWEDCRQDDGNEKTRTKKHKHLVAPEGCFSVYVGPQKQRFIVRTECANHPLFRVLLEEAETEYGYSTTGPLELPCAVDVFCRVLVKIDTDNSILGPRQGRCGFANGGVGSYGAHRRLGPSRMMAINQF